MLSIEYNLSHRFTHLKGLMRRKGFWAIVYSLLALYALTLYLQQKPHQIDANTQTQLKQKLAVKAESASPSTPSHLFGLAKPKVSELENHAWKLQGIIINADQEGVAIFEINNQVKVLKAGDKIDNNVIIKSIEPDKVLVMEDGRLKRLSLFKATEAKNSRSAATNNTARINRSPVNPQNRTQFSPPNGQSKPPRF